MEMAGECKYCRKGDKYYIMYEEKQPEPEESTIVTVKTDGSVVWIKRTGPASTHLCYEEGKTHGSAYRFDIGVIMLETTAQKVNLSLSERAACVEIEYLLDMGGIKSQNHIRLDVTCIEE